MEILAAMLLFFATTFFVLGKKILGIGLFLLASILIVDITTTG